MRGLYAPRPRLSSGLGASAGSILPVIFGSDPLPSSPHCRLRRFHLIATAEVLTDPSVHGTAVTDPSSQGRIYLFIYGKPESWHGAHGRVLPTRPVAYMPLRLENGVETRWWWTCGPGWASRRARRQQVSRVSSTLQLLRPCHFCEAN